ncbi:hypothetical protein MMC30_004937 [Trapelia coarctata]|nr:hypothetical protein [Trapelia coarctata]
MPPSPFATSTCPPGHGTVHLTLLPPATPTFSTLTYAYPLKLLPSTPHILAPWKYVDAPSTPPTSDSASHPASQPPTRPTQTPLLFLLSYGGGLLPPDTISLTLTLALHTRLTLTTQGSTKIFPSPSHSPSAIATQTLTASISAGAGLLLAPDPVQPFRGSGYTQKQVFEVVLGRCEKGIAYGEEGASLGVLDWVTEGRRSRGESWALRTYKSKLEIWATPTSDTEPRTLIMRDNLILSPTPTSSVTAKMDNLGVFGTLVLLGPLFTSLGDFFMEEFKLLPRIGGRDWGDKQTVQEVENRSTHLAEEQQRRAHWRLSRISAEKAGQVLWTAARVRGCVVVKFVAREVEGARMWLGSMWREEGTVGREFGEGGLMCLR